MLQNVWYSNLLKLIPTNKSTLVAISTDEQYNCTANCSSVNFATSINAAMSLYSIKSTLTGRAHCNTHLCSFPSCVSTITTSPDFWGERTPTTLSLPKTVVRPMLRSVSRDSDTTITVRLPLAETYVAVFSPVSSEIFRA